MEMCDEYCSQWGINEKWLKQRTESWNIFQRKRIHPCSHNKFCPKRDGGDISTSYQNNHVACNKWRGKLDLFADLSRNCLAFGWEPILSPTNAQHKCSINSNVSELSLPTIEQIKLDFDKPRLSVSIEHLSWAFSSISSPSFIEKLISYQTDWLPHYWGWTC